MSEKIYTPKVEKASLLLKEQEILRNEVKAFQQIINRKFVRMAEIREQLNLIICGTSGNYENLTKEEYEEINIIIQNYNQANVPNL